MTQHPTTQHASSAPFIEVKGSHLAIGQQLGEALRLLVQHSIENARSLVESAYDDLHLSWEGAKNQARK